MVFGHGTRETIGDAQFLVLFAGLYVNVGLLHLTRAGST